MPAVQTSGDDHPACAQRVPGARLPGEQPGRGRGGAGDAPACLVSSLAGDRQVRTACRQQTSTEAALSCPAQPWCLEGSIPFPSHQSSLVGVEPPVLPLLTEPGDLQEVTDGTQHPKKEPVLPQAGAGGAVHTPRGPGGAPLQETLRCDGRTKRIRRC